MEVNLQSPHTFSKGVSMSLVCLKENMSLNTEVIKLFRVTRKPELLLNYSDFTVFFNHSQYKLHIRRGVIGI
jgi:hypothetical protein